MSETKIVQGGGVGFGSLLAVLFIGLKLTGYISWSWYWVLAPLWIPAAMIVGLLIGCLIVAIVQTAMEAKRERKR